MLNLCPLRWPTLLNSTSLPELPAPTDHTWLHLEVSLFLLLSNSMLIIGLWCLEHPLNAMTWGQDFFTTPRLNSPRYIYKLSFFILSNLSSQRGHTGNVSLFQLMGGRSGVDDLEKEVILLINLLTAVWESFIWRNKNKDVAGRYSLGTVWGMRWILKIIPFPTLIFTLKKGSFHLFIYRSNTHLAGGFWITRV